MKKNLTSDELRAELRRRVDREFGGNITAAARAWKYKPQNLHPVLRGDIGISESLANGAGYKRVYSRA